MKSKLVKTLLIIILILSGTARANIIEDNLDDYLYLNSTSSDISGYFDMTGQDYKYAWVTIVFVDDTYLFNDDVNPFVSKYPLNDQLPVDEGELDNTRGEAGVYSHFTPTDTNFFQGSEEVGFLNQDIIETAHISFADIAGNISAPFLEPRTIGHHHHDEIGHAWVPGNEGCNLPCEYFDLEHSVNSWGYTGYFMVREKLSKGLIDSVLVDGKVEFDIGVVSGDFYLASATIETIPEPASLGLFLLTLFGLISVQRKNSRILPAS